MATPDPRQGQLQEYPNLLGIKTAPTLSNTPYHWEVWMPSEVFHEHLRRTGMMRYVLLCKNLSKIPPTILVPYNSTWDCPGRVSLWRVKTISPEINHFLITSQTDLSKPDNNWYLTPLNLPTDRDQHSQYLNWPSDDS